MHTRNKKNIPKLLSKKLADISDTKEEKAFDDWLSSSQKNKDIWTFLEDMNNYRNFCREEEKIDHKERYNDFLKERKKIKIKRLSIRAAIAASIITPIILVLLFQQNPISKEMPVIGNTTITHGSKKAILMLADGQQINLDKTSRGINLDINGTKIKSKGDTITYQNLSGTNKLEYNTLKVPRGGEFFLILSDGTKVWLNSESELKYPTQFSTKERKVFLKGEAYFKVKKNKSKTFYVNTQEQNLAVLGTEFNINSYHKDEIYTTLVEGSIKLSYNRQEVILEPNEQSFIENNELKTRTVNTKEYTAWKDGRFIFKDKKLEDIMEILSRWYNIEVFFQNSKCREIPFTGNLERFDRIENLLERIEILEKVKFRIKNNAIIIEEY